MHLRQNIIRLKQNSLFKDSFWAVLGNGIGYGLLLISGVVIGRLLGKDLYGEYGLIKTTMFQLAMFSTLGLGITSTKFIAQHIEEEKTANIFQTLWSSIKVTLLTSIALCILLFSLAHPLAKMLNEPHLAIGFRFLGIVLIFQALTKVLNGILAGFKAFKTIGINNILSGLVMLAASIPLTYYYQIKGAFCALTLFLLVNSLLNAIPIIRICKTLPKPTPDKDKGEGSTKSLLFFSFPIAAQDLSYFLCNSSALFLMTRYASLGEVGVYTAATQWCSVITFVPGLLYNVVLSHLSGAISNHKKHSTIVWQMVVVHLVCVLIPLLVVLLFSGFITSLYGPTFEGLKLVLSVAVFYTIFTSLSNVFQAEVISEGKSWTLFGYALIRDVAILTILLVAVFLGEQQLALIMSMAVIAGFALYTFILYLHYRRHQPIAQPT